MQTKYTYQTRRKKYNAQITYKDQNDGWLNPEVLKIVLDALDEKNLGAIFYFFEMSCGINGILQNVNPFDQNGVEAYKSNLKLMLKNN